MYVCVCVCVCVFMCVCVCVCLCVSVCAFLYPHAMFLLKGAWCRWALGYQLSETCQTLEASVISPSFPNRLQILEGVKLFLVCLRLLRHLPELLQPGQVTAGQPRVYDL